ncbi:hypothetical protein GJU39_10755 [Pedobacter petrophilus]|uniref:Uncharacterized protein n=1 Tax=Pedobacter petrophilus TaxID=1908241 RepID=A0A7K0FYP1_9SPHI|nr:hypothetical protein [Pedobacter petrophilus]MRX76571.1 hypothetical protein [Pedobacter petrophilus]
MKKSDKIILWIVGILAVIILPDANLYYQRYKLKGDKLPEMYKNYSTLDSISDDIYEVLEVNGANHNPVIQLNDSTIMVINKSSEETEDGSRNEINSWCKINLKGQITGSLNYAYNDRKQNHNYQTFYNYVVDFYGNTYNTWIINSDSTRKPIKNLNENKIFSVDEAEQIISTHEYLYNENIPADTSGNDRKQKILIFKNGVFNYFYADKYFNKVEPYQQDKRGLKYEVDRIDNNSGYLKRKYVKKDEWVGHTFWDSRTFSYGSGNSSGRIGWYGTAFFDVKMPNKIIHFKTSVEIEYPKEGIIERFTYSIYKPNNGDYLLLSDIQNNRHYLIRPKINKLSK